jgi:tetratricopeptide (TPR) repeat protein
VTDPGPLAPYGPARLVTPGDLLRADAAVVPFTGRQALLTELISWCLAPAPVAARLLTGPGGQGKTRLAREVAVHLANQGWQAGVLRPDWPSADTDLAAFNGDAAPVLLIVDYAETRSQQVGRLLTATWHASDIAPVRLLLLARSAGEWWTRLRLDYSDDLATATVTPLGALNTDRAELIAAWQAALVALATRLPELDPETAWQALPEIIVAPSDLASGKYESPLNLQVAALAALLQAGSRPVAEHGDSSREVLLDHEERYWRRSASSRWLNYQPSLLKLAVAAATLMGASTEQEAVAMLAQLPPLRDVTSDAQLAVARWIVDLYPAAHGEYWGGLQPDRLGEYLVADVMAADPDLLSLLVSDAPYTQSRHAFLLLSRLAEHQPILLGQIDTLIGDRFDRLAAIAVRSAAETEDPALIANSVVRAGSRASVNQVLLTVDQLLGSGTFFSDVAARLVSDAIDRLLAAFRQRSEYHRDEPTPIRALIDLSARLTALGRHEAALYAAEESVTAFRALAASRPKVFARDLASALSNKSVTLLTLGQQEAAQAAAEEAVRLFENSEDDETTEDDVSLANTYNLLARIAGDRGDSSTAEREHQRALEIYDSRAGFTAIDNQRDAPVQTDMSSGLRLELRDFEGPARWRWLLTDGATGRALADHQVNLDTRSDEYVAFTDLYRYLQRNAVPDRRAASDAAIVARVGAWAGRQVLGEAVGLAISAAAPATVQVVLPRAARFVLFWPLELAWSGGRPLAARGDVTFAYDPAGGLPGTDSAARSAERSLRMLAVFSLPSSTSVLGMRRERYELTRLIRQIAVRQGRRVELSVIQYGATRERLAAVVEAGDGWDVLHLSGHGRRGLFVLERPDGSPDLVDAAALVRLLTPLRGRVQLAVLEFQSAAATTSETLRWLGLDEQAAVLDHETAGEPAETGQSMTTLAQVVAQDLGCAVVAMRYPAADEFAITFTSELYERLLSSSDQELGESGQPLGTALARAAAFAAGPMPSPARPALSLATPILLGGRSADLVLKVPRGEPMFDLAAVRMERFPPEPVRFVGRAAAMAAAGAALAPGSERTGVLLHGMAGSGKTSAALELAYRHQDSFGAVAFWQAPLTDDEFGGALDRLAASLDVQLGGYGFAMSGLVTSEASAEAFAPRLGRALEDIGLLLVLDNLESLLTPDGSWRDPRWEPIVTALTGHLGESRVILTSRIPPTGLIASVLVLPVHALDLSESAALAREMPGLRQLLHADPNSARDDDAAVTNDRDLVRRVLRVVQGHPKLLELADAAATAGPQRLAAQLDAAERAGEGLVLDAFFRDGATALDAARFLDTLTAWTATAEGALPGPARLMAQLVACLEDDDRTTDIIEANWADVWCRLEQSGSAPDPQPLVAALAAAALVQPGPTESGGGGAGEVVSWRMHSGVAQAIRAATGPAIVAAVDTELAAFWRQVSDWAVEREGGEAGQVVVKAGLAAAPYLLRQRHWDTASTLLSRAIRRDTSPAVTAVVLPALRAIAAATQTPKDLFVLARALAVVDPAQAEPLLRQARAQAAARGDFQVASSAAGDLVDLLMGAGRLGEALNLADQTAEYASLAGLGPWTQLADQGQRLQILARTGQHRQVLTEIAVVRDLMDHLPSANTSNEAVEPWSVRELVLDTGRESAAALGEWQQALDLNAAIQASKQARGAGAREVARTRFNDYGPLLRLGRLADAGLVLADCQQVFEDHYDLPLLGLVFTARADLEDMRGNQAGAVAFEQTALRYTYLRSDPRSLAASHHNLANYLARAGSDPAGQRAHRLAAALIFQLTGMTHDLSGTIRALARELRRSAEGGPLPGTAGEVIAVAERTEGVRLGQLLAALQPDPQTLADTLAAILDAAASTDPDLDALQQHLERWEPVIALTAAAAGGDPQAADQLSPALAELAEMTDWAALVAVLRRISNGERSFTLLDGLDTIDTAIVRRVLSELTS